LNRLPTEQAVRHHHFLTTARFFDRVRSAPFYSTLLFDSAAPLDMVAHCK